MQEKKNKTLENQEMEKERKGEKRKKKITKTCHLGLPLYTVLSLGLPEYKEVLLSVPVPLAHDNSAGYISGNKQLLDL
jgi:hypothetical protein